MKRNRLFYLVILLLCAVAAIGLGTSAAFYALYSVALLPVLALISLLLYPALVGVWPACERTYIFKEETPNLLLHIRNRSPLPYPDVEIRLLDPNVQYAPEFSDDSSVLSLPALHSIDRNYTLAFPFRGVYNVGIKDAKVTDFLGLFRMRFKDERTRRITVYPKILEDFSLPLSMRQAGEGDAGFDQFADHAADITDVRKHDPSDDYRHVHWKLTAKRGEFIVKNFRNPGMTRTVVLLDTADVGHTGRMKLAFDDLMASLAASALDCCLKNRQAARLVYGDGLTDAYDLTLPEDMEHALELLAVMPFKGSVGASTAALHSLLLSRQSFAGLVLFTSHMDEALSDLLKATFTGGHEVFFYYVCATVSPSKDEYDLLDGLAAYGVSIEVIK